MSRQVQIQTKNRQRRKAKIAWTGMDKKDIGGGAGNQALARYMSKQDRVRGKREIQDQLEDYANWQWWYGIYSWTSTPKKVKKSRRRVMDMVKMVNAEGKIVNVLVRPLDCRIVKRV